jgi:hypothetical protein
MYSRIIFFLLFAVAAMGATVRLYLKDGTYQSASEYKVLADRVSYYSTERGEWEEIPLEMVDLDRTKKEAAERDAQIQAETKAQSEEDTAQRVERQEVERIPIESGVYFIKGDKLEPVKQAESKIVNDKKRNVLKIMSPIPLVSGKATVEIDGETAPFRMSQNRPEFYFRLAKEEQFAIIKLAPKKTTHSRIVENITIVPVSKEIVEEQKAVPTFKRQVADMLFKIWPEQPLEPGEYALVEFTPVEMTESSINLQLWDFGVDR